MDDDEVTAKDVEPQLVEIMVPLYSSSGCAKKIKKALANFKGIYSVNVDYKQQKVTVWGICNKMEVLSAIRAKRKGARLRLHDSTSSFSPSSNHHHSLSLNWNWKAAWKKIFNRSNSQFLTS